MIVGCILSLTFNSQEAMSQLWKAHEDRLLEPIFRKVIVTPKFLSNIGARKVVLRARVWRDEIEAATKEFERIILRPFKLQSKG